MATAPSPEASEIRRRGRRRLLGAVTLVMALVVFVPMILDNEPRTPRSEPSPVIPPKESAPPLPAPTAAKPVPAPAANAPAPSVSAQAADKAPVSASGEVAPPEPAKVEPKPAPEPAKVEPKPAAEPSSRAPQSGNAPGSNSRPAPKLEGFAVQVGAFREEERLKQARAKLEAAHVPHYTERVEGGLTRLRAGPFRTREAADAARAKLNDGKVVPLP